MLSIHGIFGTGVEGGVTASYLEFFPDKILLCETLPLPASRRRSDTPRGAEQ